MIIKVPHTQYVDVHLTNNNIDDIFLKKLYNLYNWKTSYYVKDGKVMEKVEYHTSHSFEIEETVRDASEEDYEAYEIINKIKEKLWNT